MQRKGIAWGLALIICTFALTGCSSDKTYQDGIYTAQFREYDSYGYKDFLTLTVQDGVVTEMVYDAVNEQGAMRTDDQKIQQDMSAVRDTYPKKYTADLVNQYLEKQDIGEVATIAGASWSSESFKTLFLALEPQMEKGDTTLLSIDNVPEK